MNLEKRHLHLLRKRYRLPISLLTHETPPGSPLLETGFEESADAEGVRVTGLVTCLEDARGLTSMCSSGGVTRLSIRYADYVSLACVDMVKQHIAGVRKGEGKGGPAAYKIVILNPGTPKEKIRLLTRLENLSMKLADAKDELANEGNKLQQRERLQDLRIRLGMALESATLHTSSSEQAKDDHLDWLLFLELNPDAPPHARQEGIWLLKHLRPTDHAYAHLDGSLFEPALAVVRRRIEERVVDHDDTPSGANLRDARRSLLGAVGRHHIEVKLLQALGQACTAIDQYLKEEATKVEVSNVIKSQRKVMLNLMNKRSLIGCHFIDLGDDITNEYDYYTDSEQSKDVVSEASGQGENDPSDENDDVMYEYGEDEDDANAIYGEGEDDEEVMHADEHEGENDDEAMLTEESEDEDDEYDEEDGDVSTVRDMSQEDDGMSVSQRSPNSSESSINGPAEAEVTPKEESPISTSSFVSTQSEIGHAGLALSLSDLEQDDEENSKLNAHETDLLKVQNMDEEEAQLGQSLGLSTDTQLRAYESERTDILKTQSLIEEEAQLQALGPSTDTQQIAYESEKSDALKVHNRIEDKVKPQAGGPSNAQDEAHEPQKTDPLEMQNRNEDEVKPQAGGPLTSQDKAYESEKAGEPAAEDEMHVNSLGRGN